MENKQNSGNKASKYIEQEQLFQLHLKLAEDARKYLEKEFQWYLKSAKGGNSYGQNSLGDCYRNRIGTTKDEEKAFQ
ncbi:hypothetical protein Glove_812016g2 [Diversispora epigaea]|uniref:Uncharacterized protein n=1 Tax=Diversispora epigaea TaxID=1348612 RepID=A0A397FZQ4_9GLOM|nr:hypothetical protein Glove_812016g2 [Diversispora epigaea]